MNDYERYEQKIRSVAAFLDRLRRYAPYIIAALLLIAFSILCLLFVTGTVSDEVVCNSIRYGDELRYSAGFLWTEARYEFSRKGSDQRTEEPPCEVGDYVIHAYGENVFGKRRYSEKEFSIKRRELSIALSDFSIIYGDSPSVDSIVRASGLCKGHRLLDERLVYDADNIGRSEATLDAGALCILDEFGKDVTENYEIAVKGAYATVLRRPISISTPSILKIYDGSPAESDGSWIISSGSLAFGHTASVRAEGAVTEVGKTKNRITYVAITDSEGRSVSELYDITSLEGEIRVVYGIIRIGVADKTAVYSGKPIKPDAFTVLEGALLAGDKISSVTLKGGGTSVGSYKTQIASYAVMRGDKDVTEDYIVEAVEGRLDIVPLEIVLKTEDRTKVYDSNPLTDGTFEIVSGVLPEGHVIIGSDFARVTPAKTVENSFTATVNDENGNDVTDNYSIIYQFGKLTVTKRRLKLIFHDMQLEYFKVAADSFNASFTLKEGTLVNGHYVYAKPIFDKPLTSPGAYPFTCDITVRSNANNEYTDNYEIEAEYGVYTVEKSDIVIVTASNTKTYDGMPLDNTQKYNLTLNGFNPIPDGVLTEPYIRFLVDSVTNVCNIPNDIDHNITLRNLAGEDVTDMFNVIISIGTLRIDPRNLMISPKGTTKKYDGKPLYASGEYTFSEMNSERFNGLINGHRIENVRVVSQPITDVGSSRVTIDAEAIRVYNSKGEDVTANYNISTSVAYLQINKRPLSILTESAFKYFDGKPLTKNGYSIINETSLAEGEGLHISVTGSITHPGTVPNTAIISMISKADGTDSTGNYDIFLEYGRLTVLDDSQTMPPSTEETSSPSVGGDESGSGGSGEENPREPGANLDTSGSIGIPPNVGDALTPGDNSEISAFSVYSTESHMAYLKIASFGGFTGKNWKPADNYKYLLNDKYSYSYLTGIFLKSAGMRKINMKLSLGDRTNYVLPYFLSTEDDNYTVQRSDASFEGTEREYSLYYYFYDLMKNGIPKGYLPDEYAAREKVYRNYVYDEYISLPQSTAAYFKQLLSERDFGSTKEEKIKNIVEYVRSSATYSLNYDRALDAEFNVAIAFIDEYKEGVCQHFATAATAMLRAAGIPARYTVGWIINTEAGKWVKQRGAAHAWVEVYIDGVGWMYVDPTPFRDLDIFDIIDGLTDVLPEISSPDETTGNAAGDAPAEPADKEILRFRTGYTGAIFFRDFNYGDYNHAEEKWNMPELLREEEFLRLQLYYATNALMSTGSTEYKVKVDYTIIPDRELVPYFITSPTRISEMQGDAMIPYSGRKSITYSFIPAMRSGNCFVGASLDEKYREVEALYFRFARKHYLDVSESELYALSLGLGIEELKEGDGRIASLLARIRALCENDVTAENAGDIPSLDQLKAGYLATEQDAITVAVLALRAIGYPARYVEGYIAYSVSSRTVSVFESDRACWAEIYVEGIGWIPLSIRENVHHPFEEDDDLLHKKLSIKLDSPSKSFDHKPLVGGGYYVTDGGLLSGHRISISSSSEQTYVGTSSNKCDSITITDEKGNDVTAVYALSVQDGRLSVYPMLFNPTNSLRCTVGDRLDLKSLRWWCGDISAEINIYEIPGQEGIEITEDGIVTVKKAGAYRLAVSSLGADLNGDGILELEKYPITEITLRACEFSSVVFEDMPYAEALMRGIVAPDKHPKHFSPDGEHVGLVIRMNSASKPYDGMLLRADGADVIMGKLRDGDSLEVYGSGSITFCGTAENGCAGITVRDGEGRDVTYLYAITVYSGELKVTTAVPESINRVKIGIGETMSIRALFRSDSVSNYPISVSLSEDSGSILFDGETVRGRKAGVSVLCLTLHGCDLNGDGYYEYSPTSFAVRIETGISAWMIIAAAILAFALLGYILINIPCGRERGKK